MHKTSQSEEGSKAWSPPDYLCQYEASKIDYYMADMHISYWPFTF